MQVYLLTVVLHGTRIAIVSGRHQYMSLVMFTAGPRCALLSFR